MNGSSERRSNSRVVVGLSGGVDSAVAAVLLRNEGYEVHSVALKMWQAHEDAVPQHTRAGLRARAAAHHLGIPLIERDVQQAFYTRVVAPFAAAYASGQTPNPCVFCNPTLKFATLLEEADTLGARWIATGHYARVVHTEQDPSRLYQARADAKDQSYALYRLDQMTLSRLLLPLGEMTDKSQVREIAREMELPVAEADDSQDLCFVAAGEHAGLVGLLEVDAIKPGPIYDLAGDQIGEHKGLPHYTVGQRSGLGITAAERLYVVRLEPQQNALVVGPRAALETASCHLTDVTFTTEAPDSTAFEALGRIRYRAPLVPVRVTLQASDRVDVTFAEPQRGVAPGQSLVFYRDGEVLGGGVIAPSDAAPSDR